MLFSLAAFVHPDKRRRNLRGVAMQCHVVPFASCFALFVAVSAPFAVRTGSAAPAKDVWLKAKSKHFMLIGDASEKEIRNAGMRLEQFSEAFSQIFSQIF